MENFEEKGKQIVKDGKYILEFRYRADDSLKSISIYNENNELTDLIDEENEKPIPAVQHWKNGELNYYCYYNNGIKHNDDGYAEFILLKDKNMMYRKIINGEIKNKKLIKFSLSF